MRFTINTQKVDYTIKQLNTKHEKQQCLGILIQHSTQIFLKSGHAVPSKHWFEKALNELINEEENLFYSMNKSNGEMVAWSRMVPQKNELGQIYVCPNNDDPEVAEKMLHFTEGILGSGAFLWLWEHDYNAEKDSLFQKNGWYFSGQQKEVQRVNDVFTMKKFEFFGN